MNRSGNQGGSSKAMFDQDIELQTAGRFGGSSSSSSGGSPASIALENANEFAERHARNFEIDDDYDDDDIVYRETEEETIGLNTVRNGSEFQTKIGPKAIGGNFLRKFRSKSGKRQCLIIFLICLAVWIGFLASYARGHNLSNTNKYHPAVGGNSTTAQQHHTNPAKYGGRKQMSLEAEREGMFYVFNENIDMVKQSTEPDEGYYVQKSDSSYTLKKAADPGFSQRILKKKKFKYNNDKFFVSDVTLDPTMKYALVTSERESIWRHSGLAFYFIYDLAMNTFTPLLEVQLEDGSVFIPKMSFADFSPKGSYVSYVYENNVYVCNVTQTDMPTIQLTEDGSDTIYNGKADWVYEEEVLSTDRAIWWAPDESSVSFMKLDDSNVPVFYLDLYSRNGGSSGEYPDEGKVRYPTPGKPNPVPTLFSFSFSKNTMTTIPREGSTLGDDYIVYYVKWVSNSQMLIKESDRASNVMDVRLFDSESKTSTVVRRVDATKEYNGWINIKNEIQVVPPANGRSEYGYIDLVVSNGYEHLGYFETVSASTPKMLTEGQWQLTEAQFKFDPHSEVVYFLSGGELGIDSLLHAVSLNGTSWALIPSNEDGRGFYAVEFSTDALYAIVYHQGPEVPTQKLVSLRDFNLDAYQSTDSLGSTALTALSLKDYALPTKQYYNYTVDKGIELNVIEVRPPFFNESETYPLLVSVYGGPGSQKVSSTYGYGFEEVFAASLGAIVLYIDPRGTGGKGWEFQAYANGKIGYWEPRDLTAATKQLIRDKTYIDPSRTAIWGWSYGGFTTLKTLEYDGGDVFKYGMAVAPVTNWKLYDSIYTERYMDSIANNENGYNEYAVIKDIDKFKNVERFLVMHGTADDNVHFENTLDLLDVFNEHKVENYDVHVFPHSNHNIAYHNANTIVYDKLFSWLRSSFKL